MNEQLKPLSGSESLGIGPLISTLFQQGVNEGAVRVNISLSDLYCVNAFAKI